MSGILFSMFGVLMVTVGSMWGYTTAQVLSMLAILVSVLHFFTSLPGSLAWKSVLYLRGTTQFVLSSEKKGMKKGIPDPDAVLKCASTKKKTIVFIRHGESVWNEMFNKGFMPPGFFFRVLRGIVREIHLLTTRDSVFYDSPLSAEGVSQAKDLAIFLRDESNAKSSSIGSIVKTLRGDKDARPSVIVSSNLRRAAATTFIGLYDRIKKSGDKILLMSVLQEMSRNVDTVAVSPPRKLARLPVLERRYGADGYPAYFDCASQGGNKSPFRRAYKDFLAFNEWVFQRPEETIIVGGHSLWFKQYYRAFLPSSSDHDAKKFKMVNAGTIGFELTRGEDSNGSACYRIAPESMKTVFGGYKRK